MVVCPACLFNAGTVHDVGWLAPFVAHRTGVDSELGRTCTCGSCGFRWCSVRWSDEQAAALYRGYRDSAYDAERSRFEPGYSSAHLNEPREYLPLVEAWIARHGVPGSVLDIGGNDGRNTPFSDRAMVWEIGEPEPNGTYDLVVLAHVLEHVPWPRHTVAAAREKLAPGGVLYVEVPAEAPCDVWHEHVNQFSRESLGATLGRLLDYQELGTSLGPVRMALSK